MTKRREVHQLSEWCQIDPSASLEIEGWMEEKMGEIEGSFQGGSIDVVPPEHARSWREMIPGLNNNFSIFKKRETVSSSLFSELWSAAISKKAQSPPGEGNAPFLRLPLQQ